MFMLGFYVRSIPLMRHRTGPAQLNTHTHTHTHTQIARIPFPLADKLSPHTPLTVVLISSSIRLRMGLSRSIGFQRRTFTVRDRETASRCCNLRVVRGLIHKLMSHTCCTYNFSPIPMALVATNRNGNWCMLSFSKCKAPFF